MRNEGMNSCTRDVIVVWVRVVLKTAVGDLGSNHSSRRDKFSDYPRPFGGLGEGGGEGGEQLLLGRCCWPLRIPTPL